MRSKAELVSLINFGLGVFQQKGTHTRLFMQFVLRKVKVKHVIQTNEVHLLHISHPDGSYTLLTRTHDASRKTNPEKDAARGKRGNQRR